MTKIEKQQMKLNKVSHRADLARELDDLAIRTLNATKNKKLRLAAEKRLLRRLK